MTKEREFDFEKALERLDEIVEAFDSGEMTLRQMEASFVEGMNLIKQCTKCLDAVELRVQELSETDRPIYEPEPLE